MERSRSFSQRSGGGGEYTTTAYATDLRCHSASYYVAASYAPPSAGRAKKAKPKATAAAAAWPPSGSSSAAAAARAWGGLGGPDLQRKRRVAGYSAYCMEGKVKGSLKSGVRWLKCKCARVVDGWW